MVSELMREMILKKIKKKTKKDKKDAGNEKQWKGLFESKTKKNV